MYKRTQIKVPYLQVCPASYALAQVVSGSVGHLGLS